MLSLGRFVPPRLKGRRVSLHVGALCALSLVGAALALGIGSADAAPSTDTGKREAESKGEPRRSLRGFDPTRQRLVDGRLLSPLPGGRRAWLTLDPSLQSHLLATLRRYEVPHAAVVAMEPGTGRLLAYVSHSASGGSIDVVRDASPPAASVFKLVTSAALLESGVRPGTKTCYHGGFSQLTARDLRDDPRRDTCVTLTTALARSVNSVFGKLAIRHLSAKRLRRYADAFGFGQAPPFDAPTQPSAAAVPPGDIGLARTAAGFWNMHMSPLHAVTIAATIANRGRMMRPFAVEKVADGAGRVTYQAEPALHRAVVGRRTAELLGRMMRATVTRGTARKSFYDAHGNAFLPGIEVAGKTGTLSAERPYRGFTWWVGFAPADAPTIAVAALIVNTPKWRIKAPYLAREALRHYLVEIPRRRRRQAAREAAGAQQAVAGVAR